jgi:hypothetical protein
MPQFTTLSINDGSATPVAVAFQVEKLSTEQTILVDRREASRDLQPTLAIIYDRPTPTRKTTKIRHSIAYPLKHTVNGVVMTSDTARVNVEFILPQTMTASDRKNLHAFIVNAEQSALIKAGVLDLDPLY